MHERHSALAKAALAKVTEAVRGLDPRKLSPNQLAKLLEVSIRTERLSRGLSADLASEAAPLNAVEIRAFLRAEGLLDGHGQGRLPDGDDDGEAIAKSDPVAQWVNQHDGM